MKIVVYVLCHDDHSRRVATEAHAGSSWARVLHIPTTRYLENVVYEHVLGDRPGEWVDADFVGTLSWKAHLGTRLPPRMHELGAALRGAYDVVAFVSPAHAPFASAMVEHAAAAHPPFLAVWVPLLRELGIPEEEAVSDAIPGFFCNNWMATPAWMALYTAFFQRARRLLDTLPGVRDALWSSSGYRGAIPRERLMEIYGVPYYPMHAFVCERLPCVFFWRHGARVFRWGVDARPPGT